MGIRFFCPNGHKLNVKEHLAGKAGFCPECGVRLIIPYHSTRKSSKEQDKEPNKEHHQPEEQAPAKYSISPSSFFMEEMEKREQQQEQLPPGESPDASLQHINPILRDQTVVWYIQVPGGPQYGPASGLVVHAWIKEHRIGPTMLVWREGWANWLEAKNVFPELE